jgi:LytS/YehU family sensor histidine kinase
LAGLSTIVWGYTEKWLLETFIYKTDLQADWLTKSMPVRFWIGLLNIVWLMAVVYFWERIEEEKDVKERKNTLEKSVREAELYKLRQQLSPHFLFNSLNSINALIHSRPDEARRMVHQLSDFLRGTLKQEEDHFVTLKEELNYLKLYLDIEKVRFGHRLKVEFDTREDALDCKMPPMLLQPLLENAIKFGLYGTTGEAKIGLRARIIDHYLVIAIMNPYDPDMQMPEGTGFGLKSIRRRLYLLFGRDDLVEINQDKNVFVVIFRIPQFTVS